MLPPGLTCDGPVWLRNATGQRPHVYYNCRRLDKLILRAFSRNYRGPLTGFHPLDTVVARRVRSVRNRTGNDERPFTLLSSPFSVRVQIPKDDASWASVMPPAIRVEPAVNAARGHRQHGSVTDTPSVRVILLLRKPSGLRFSSPSAARHDR
jgi:hypothetical protein